MQPFYRREGFLSPTVFVVSVSAILSFVSFQRNVGAQMYNDNSMPNDYIRQDLETRKEKTYEALAGIPLNCSRTLPPGAMALMRNISANLLLQKLNKPLKIPDEYLHNCLRAHPYNTAQFPIGFTNHTMNIKYA